MVASVRMQSRYWTMVRHAIVLARKELSDKMDSLRVQIGDDKKLVYNSEYLDALHDYNRYDAIDELVREAESKKDSPFSSGIGPDAPPPPLELTSEEEEKIRWIESID